jgi:hypothetical protein
MACHSGISSVDVAAFIRLSFTVKAAMAMFM